MAKLDDINKENPFKVPDGYFDTLTDKVMDKIKQQESNKKTKNISFMPYFAFAASMLILFGIWTLLSKQTMNPTQQNTQQELVLDDVDMEAVEQELGDYIDYEDFTDMDISQMYAFEEVDDNEIFDYLADDDDFIYTLDIDQ